MPDEQYPPNQNLTPDSGDSLFMTQAESDARYLQRSGLVKVTASDAAPGAPATNDVWIETD